MRVFISIGLALVSALTWADVSFDNAYIRAMPPGQPNTAAYFTIVNHSDAPLVLTSAESDVAAKVEYHQHIKKDGGVMAMRKVDAITVPSHGSFEFKPGGHHVMFMGLNTTLKGGDIVTLTLKDQNNQTYPVSLSAKAPGGMPKQDHHEHHHHHHE